MTGKRKLTDGILNGLTYLSSGIAVIILIMVVQFILARGWGGVNIELLTKPYWSGNHTIEFPQFKTGQFDKPESLGDEIAFSSKLGIGLSDGLDAYKEHQVVVEYIDPDSPLQRGIVSTAGVDLGKERGLVEGANIVNLMLIDTQGDLVNVGAQRKSTAEDTVIAMDQVSQIRKLYFKTEGGGIRGSLIATLYL
ncbi:MAG: phosphate ABC transporter, permease protein PstA, partial [Tissierellia bacterium]|nr:phosphate ABC transporter, permease protein PstA [Tissierellia bacterium]